MTYCSIADVRQALAPEWAEGVQTNTAADLDDTAIQDAADQASAEIDTYVNGPYESTDYIPDVIRFWTRDIGAYYATLSWRKAKNPGPNDPVVIRYNQAIARLNLIAQGELDIPTPAAPSDQAVIVNQTERTFFHERDFTLSDWPGYPGFRIWTYMDWMYWTGDDGF